MGANATPAPQSQSIEVDQPFYKTAAEGFTMHATPKSSKFLTAGLRAMMGGSIV